MKTHTRTPGDWILLRWGKEIQGHPDDAGHIIQANDGTIGVDICTIPVASETAEMLPNGRSIHKRVVSRKESLANARLLVAAPKMLDAIAELNSLARGAVLEKMTVENLAATLEYHTSKLLKRFK